MIMLLPNSSSAPHKSMKNTLNYSNIEVFKKNPSKYLQDQVTRFFFIFMTKSPFLQ